MASRRGAVRGRARGVGLQVTLEAAVAGGALAWPALALGQDALTGQGIAAHATFTNVGVQVTISGDANHDGSATLELDVGGAGFRPVHRLSRATDTSFVGSAFFLPPATGYEVRVTLTDPDGVTNGTLSTTGTTRVAELPQSAGETYHVAPDGDDGGAGSEASPFATIGRGLAQAGPGDTVLVHSGRYHEEIQLPTGGAADAPLTLRAAGDGVAVLDGAEPALLAAGAWNDEGGGVYGAAVSATRYVSVDGVRLWRYESLGELQSLSAGTDGGFFHDGATVHVRLPGGAAPSGHEIQVSTLGRALWLEGTPHVVIQGLTIRCYGAEEYSQGIMVRDGSHGVWIVDNVFENVMPGIWVKNDVDDLTVRGNEFSDRGLAEFPWDAVKAQGGMESGAISLDNAYDGQGIVFEDNSVHDSFDGLHICGDTPMTHPNNADVVGNWIEHLGDDGMETDGECSNIRVIGNYFRDSLTAVSVAPAVTGPTYVVRNVASHLANVAPSSSWMTRFMKFNVGDDRPTGETFAYHNTAAVYEAEQSAWTITDDSLWTAVHLANNIWIGTDYAFYHENSGDEPLFEDYDLLYSTGSRLVRYQGTSYDTLADYFAGTGQCEHGLNAPPAFLDEAGEDYRLSEASPAVDVGLPIPGINDGFAGAAPDIGAFELGAEEPEWPDAGTGGHAGSDGGTGAFGASGGAATGGGSAAGGGEEDSGCGCRAAGCTRESWSWLALVAPVYAMARNARRRQLSVRRSSRRWLA